VLAIQFEALFGWHSKVGSVATVVEGKAGLRSPCEAGLFIGSFGGASRPSAGCSPSGYCRRLRGVSPRWAARPLAVSSTVGLAGKPQDTLLRPLCYSQFRASRGARSQPLKHTCRQWSSPHRRKCKAGSSRTAVCFSSAVRGNLTPPSSGRSKGRFAPFGPPLMSNVRPPWRRMVS